MLVLYFAIVWGLKVCKPSIRKKWKGVCARARARGSLPVR